MTIQYYEAVLASGVASSTVVDFGAESYSRVYCNNEAGFAVSFEGSGDGDTYYPVWRQDDAIDGVSGTTLIVGSASSGRWRPIPLGFRYVKAIATGSTAGAQTVYFSKV